MAAPHQAAGFMLLLDSAFLVAAKVISALDSFCKGVKCGLEERRSNATFPP